MPEKSTTVSALAGALVAVGAWAAHEFGGVTIPPEIAAAIATIVMALLTHLVPDKS